MGTKKPKKMKGVSLVIAGDDTSPILTLTLHKVVTDDELKRYTAKALEGAAGWLDTAREEQKLPLFSKTVGKLGLKSETINLLATVGISYIGDLVQKTEEALWEIEGMEQRHIDEIEIVLAKKDLDLDMATGLWTRPSKPSSVNDL